MKRKWLAIGISTVSVILLVLTSLSNVGGYQTVRTLRQQTIKEGINLRELLFQTICDISNNKEIQRIILKFQMRRGIFPTSEMPILMKNQLKRMYFIGLIPSKIVSNSKVQSMIGKYKLNSQEIQKEINAVIEKDAILNKEITQLKNSECDCDNHMSPFEFTIICEVLRVICGFFGIFPYLFFPIWGSAFFIAIILECYWTLP